VRTSRAAADARAGALHCFLDFGRFCHFTDILQTLLSTLVVPRLSITCLAAVRALGIRGEVEGIFRCKT
jgi:hypothetical protein